MFEWDAAKAESNLRKHGIDFEDVAAAFGSIGLTLRSGHVDEVRYQTFMLMDRRLICVVWTPRAGTIRLISARRANREERERFGQALRRAVEAGEN